MASVQTHRPVGSPAGPVTDAGTTVDGASLSLEPEVAEPQYTPGGM
jgi:hypothetical protein